MDEKLKANRRLDLISHNKLPAGYDPLAWPGTYYVPNTFSRWERIKNTILAVALLTYGTLGVLVDDLFIPGNRTSGLHLHGIAAWLMYAAIILGASVLLTLVVDHYDRRRNEHYYHKYKRIVSNLAACLFVVALVWHVWDHSL